ncbi:MAG: anhydro-N-acetylmuramic acid kinase, partial [Phycisphaerae bacterium]|nr:anhydro-N-acetylmuramic acid kinase [Phycisphaerae bacterium]
MSDPPKTRMVAGAMSGTSLDAIDAALVRIEGRGLEMQVEVVNTLSYPMRSLGKMLRPVTAQKRQTAEQVAKASMMLGLSHAVLLSKLIGSHPLDLVAVHGQTVYHEGAVSMQLINPHPIVRELGVPVVYDLRGADIAAGGHGAPITPLADHILFRDDQETRAVVNLGGFANFTWLPPSQRSGDAARSSIRGGDICACNQILDAVARRAFRRKYDRDGSRALKGEVDPEARKILVGLLSAQVEGSGSLGTGDELIDWVNMF